MKKQPHDKSDKSAPALSLCQQQGYLPVPLRNIPFEALVGLDLYLQKHGAYTLYRSKNLALKPADVTRLIESQVHYAYVPVQDHQRYYQTLEKGLSSIVADPDIQQARKAEILYSTCIALADQLYEKLPDQQEIQRVQNVSRSIAELVMQDENAFRHLFDVSNHDFYTATHMVNVCLTMVSLGLKMGLDQDVIHELGTGALLHDIGKLFVPTEILNCRRRLNSDEIDLMRSHVEKGYEYLLENTSLSEASLAVVFEHHERLDGSGYPRGLRGNEISIYGRMAGIVDCYEAMTAVRPYRGKTFTLQQTLQHLKAQTPQQLDHEILCSFDGMIKDQLLDDEDIQSDPTSQWQYAIAQHIHRMKRIYFRLPLNVRLVVRAGDHFRLSPAKRMIVHNMSCSGVAILSPRLMEIGANLHLSVPALECLNPDPLLAHVVRCKDHGDGWFTVGAKFFEPQPEKLINQIRTITMVTEELQNA